MAIEALPPQVGGSVVCGGVEHRLGVERGALLALDHPSGREDDAGLCPVLVDVWARVTTDAGFATDVLQLALLGPGALPALEHALDRLAGRVADVPAEGPGERLAFQAVLAQLPDPLLDEVAALAIEHLAGDWRVRGAEVAGLLGHQLEAWLRPRLRALGHDLPPGRRGLVVHLTSPGGLPFPVLSRHVVTLHLPVDVVPELVRTGDANLVYAGHDGDSA